jgi:hypothetical protein
MKNSSPAAIARRWLLVLASLALAGCTFLQNELLALDRAPPKPPGAPSGGTARP